MCKCASIRSWYKLTSPPRAQQSSDNTAKTAAELASVLEPSSEITPAAARDASRAVFDELDVDQDGRLSETEIRALCSAVWQNVMKVGDERATNTGKVQGRGAAAAGGGGVEMTESELAQLATMIDPEAITPTGTLQGIRSAALSKK